MTEALSAVTFAVALLLYGGASALFFFDVAGARAPRGRAPSPSLPSVALPPFPDAGVPDLRPIGRPSLPSLPLDAAAAAPSFTRHAPLLLGLGALAHAAYVTIASFVAHVCPVHSVHFMLSVASLLATATYVLARRRFRIDALGLVVGPLGLAFLLGTFFLGKPGPEPKLPSGFIAAHVLANLLGIAFFLLAGAAATLYLVQEKRLKRKRAALAPGNLPALDTLDRAVHRFLAAGFLPLTLGVVTGTFWARRLEMGHPDEIMRTVFGYATWLLVATVLVLRVAAGWRGRRAAYGTIAGLACAGVVLVIYLFRPAIAAGGGDRTEPRAQVEADVPALPRGGHPR
ncbi:cytochrome C assembly family protein [Chondromyces apiculatus]|uniref:Cytochrome c assembly protein n=1 Tax=Chondromyces apiculatus DSM 436 TaxID=1192034 RepID=A0A017SZM9_9BACT|nr:cytochrome c biogenesis protein CcsA [Chondromyces apiculatus]EYF02428.1 cytochrome c assembly protein [Chondromyces apiculatus DSM 436]